MKNKTNTRTAGNNFKAPLGACPELVSGGLGAIMLMLSLLAGFSAKAQGLSPGACWGQEHNYLQKWQYNLGNYEECRSQIYDDGTNIGIGTTAPEALLHMQIPSSYVGNLLLVSDENEVGYMGLVNAEDPYNSNEIGSVFVIPTTQHLPGVLVSDKSIDNLSFMAYGNGTVIMGGHSLDIGSYNHLAQLYISKMNDYDFMMNVTKENGSSIFSIRNEGYIGIGGYNSANGYGSAMLRITDKSTDAPDHTVLITNSNRTETYFVVNPKGVGVGTDDLSGTFTVKGNTGTTVDFKAADDGTDWNTQLRFLSAAGVAQHVLLNDKGKLKLYPGYLGEGDNVFEIRGKVQIGDVATPSGYNLYVENGILAERYKCALKTTSDWSDYVFDKNYELMSLADLETYVTKHHHLPNVPSAEQVVKEGIDLGKMDAKLLEKIEELSLYVIKQQKEIDELKKSR